MVYKANQKWKSESEVTLKYIREKNFEPKMRLWFLPCIGIHISDLHTPDDTDTRRF